MAITESTYAVGTTLGELMSSQTALIASSFYPSGSPAYIDGKFVQLMLKGSLPGNLAALETDIDTIEAADLAAVAVTEYLVNGAIGVTRGNKALTKATAGAYTLAAPATDGAEITVFAATAAAHVVTATGLLEDGITGGAKDTLTFAAFVGASATLVGFDGQWIVKSLNAVTVA